MSGLIPRSLITEFQNTVDELNESYDDGGLGKKIQLIFETGLRLSSESLLQSQVPDTHQNIGLQYGGRGQASSTTGREGLVDNQGSGVYIPVESVASKIIYGRIYPVNKPFQRMSLGITANQNVWQMNVSREYLPDILRCKEAILDVDFKGTQVRVRLFQSPAQYGLGESHQCKSFWIEI